MRWRPLLSSRMETAVFGSRSEAETSAVPWMEELAESSDYDWEWDTPTTLFSEPAPGFPCRVIALATPTGDGFVPCLAFTAGIKYEGRYWQGRLTDDEGTPLGLQEAVCELGTILEVLVPASQTYIPG